MFDKILKKYFPDQILFYDLPCYILAGALRIRSKLHIFSDKIFMLP
jgi:hypothetical protein